MLGSIRAEGDVDLDALRAAVTDVVPPYWQISTQASVAEVGGAVPHRAEHEVRLRLARNEEGRLRLQRTYTFEFSETGDNRRRGAIVLLGAEVADLRLEPYALSS